MASKQKAKWATSKTHTVRWAKEEWQAITKGAADMTAECPPPMVITPQDLIRIAVRQFLDARQGAVGSEK